MRHGMRNPPEPDEEAQIRYTAGGCPYVCSADGEVIRLADYLYGEDDNLPIGPDLTAEEESLL